MDDDESNDHMKFSCWTSLYQIRSSVIHLLVYYLGLCRVSQIEVLSRKDVDPLAFG
jgi:hypothetical protein